LTSEVALYHRLTLAEQFEWFSAELAELVAWVKFAELVAEPAELGEPVGQAA